MKIWAHTIVRNEERYLWFAVRSIIDYVDKVLLWDTGSTDSSLKIIKELKRIYKDRIDFREFGEVSAQQYTEIRQIMLAETKADWIILVDGDEVWWCDSISTINKIIHKRGEYLETISNRYYNVVGDIFHYQDEIAGKYNIDGNTGHLTIRAFNTKIPGLHMDKPHGQHGLFDNKKRLIQVRDSKKRLFLDQKMYMHFTHMIRSSSISENNKVIKRKAKIKYELGKEFPADFHYPEVFFDGHPEYIASPWDKRSGKYLFKAGLQTPFRYFKRRFLKTKSGY